MISLTEETKYPLNELLAQSQEIFGVKREVVVGALHGIEVTNNEFAVDEVKAYIKEFLRRKVR